MKAINKEKIKNYIFLHLCILVYTITPVLSKIGSKFEFLSYKYILTFIAMLFVLGIYALLWQQIIKKFDASVAYSNKSVTTIWTLLISAIFFNEGITVCNVIGAILIICGVVLVVNCNE